MSGSQTPSSNANAKHPNSSFNSTYPYCKTIITPGGHMVIMDDTPGNETLSIQHTGGTHVEIDQNGRWNQVVMENGHFTYNGGVSEAVAGHKDVMIQQSYNLNVNNSMQESTASDRMIMVGGNLLVGTKNSRHDDTLGDRSETVGGNHEVLVSGDVHRSIAKDNVDVIGGNKVDIITGDWAVRASGSVEIVNDGGTVRIKCTNFIIDAQNITFMTESGPINITSADGISISSGGPINMNGGGATNITGSPVDVNGHTF